MKVTGILTGCASGLALLYKIFLFIKLSKNGRLKLQYRNISGFGMVLAYGAKGAHVHEDGEQNTGYAPLLGDDPAPVPRRENSTIEMGRRDSMTNCLENAGLERFADHFSKLGVHSTSDLKYLDENAMESVGIQFIQRKRILEAVQQQQEEQEEQEHEQQEHEQQEHEQQEHEQQEQEQQKNTTKKSSSKKRK